MVPLCNTVLHHHHPSVHLRIITYRADYKLNDQKFFNTQISKAQIRIFLHYSGENISGYFKTLELYTM